MAKEPGEPKERSKTDVLLGALDRFRPLYKAGKETRDSQNWSRIFDSLYGKDFSGVEEFEETFTKEMEGKNWEDVGNKTIILAELSALLGVVKAFQEK